MGPHTTMRYAQGEGPRRHIFRHAPQAPRAIGQWAAAAARGPVLPQGNTG
ncbi:MAG: hypothetical protein ACP5EP_05830 [Acidobacteriaceae bacterium]